MIFALALSILAMPQEPAPQQQKPEQAGQVEEPQQQQRKPSAEEIQAWWSGLTEEEQGQYRERLKRYQELQPTLQEELGRRHGLLSEERQRVMQNLTEQEQQQFEGLGCGERRRFLDDRAQTSLRQRGQRLEQDFPGLGPPPPQEDWSQRRARVAKAFEEQRAPQVREAIAQAVADGWIGASAAKWLETAPIYEAMSALGEVRKWQFLQQASEKGLWEEMGFDEQRRREFAQMPAMDFFQTMRGQREGRQRGHGEFGNPGERRGEGRGNGDPRGPGKGRRSGERGPGEAGAGERGAGPGDAKGPGDGRGPGPGRRRGGPDGPGGPPPRTGPPNGERPGGPPPEGARPAGPPNDQPGTQPGPDVEPGGGADLPQQPNAPSGGHPRGRRR